MSRERSPLAEKPTVSVIITCCNGRQWIARAVESALSQTYRDFEIIVVDDASSDGSGEVLERFLNHPGFRLLQSPERRGIPATKNAGLRLAHGRYIAFLEQDDEWLPQKLAEQVGFLDRHPEVAMVAADALVVDSRGREWVQRKPISIPLGPREERTRAFFTRNLVTSMSSVVMRKDCVAALGGFDGAYSGADDYDFWLRLADFHCIVRLNTPLFRFRLHSKSYSSTNAERMLQDSMRILPRAVERNPFLEPMKAKRLARAELLLAVRTFESGATVRPLLRVLRILTTQPGLATAYPIALLMLVGPAGRLLLKLVRAALFRIRFKKLRREKFDMAGDSHSRPTCQTRQEFSAGSGFP